MFGSKHSTSPTHSNIIKSRTFSAISDQLLRTKSVRRNFMISDYGRDSCNDASQNCWRENRSPITEFQYVLVKILPRKVISFVKSAMRRAQFKNGIVRRKCLGIAGVRNLNSKCILHILRFLLTREYFRIMLLYFGACRSAYSGIMYCIFTRLFIVRVLVNLVMTNTQRLPE